jgi:hypothetical protein
MRVIRKTFAVVLVAVLAAAAVSAAGGNPQVGVPAEPLLVKGRIAYVERLGGFIIQGVDPVGEMRIVNPDPAVLRPLVDSTKVVRIKGRFTIGADHFRIEKIDDKAYPAAKAK